MKPQHEDRLLFLKQFTKELIIQSKPETIDETKPLETKKEIPEISELPVLVPIPELQKPEIIPEPKKIPLIKPQIKPISPTTLRLQPRLMPSPRYRLKPMISPKFKPSISPPTQIQQPQPAPLPQDFRLGKIDFLIKDPRVTVIECPGPNKFVLARTAGQTRVTKISLNQNQIQEIIKNFSEKAKIPIISGLFKAALGNLVITAVISELVGSRFIITKITPRFILEQAGKK